MDAMLAGSWVLLQNCHLDLELMERLEPLLAAHTATALDNFRLFLTAEPKDSFPIALLHTCIKVGLLSVAATQGVLPL
jgi:dynein heavy chain